MTLRMVASTTVHRPIEEVFAFLADFHNEYLWVGNLLYIEQLSPGPIGLGTMYWQMQSGVGHPISDCTVTAFEPNRRIAIDAVSLSGELHGTHEVAPTTDGTLVTATAEMQPRGIGRVLFRLLRRSAERELATSLARLAGILDEGLTTTP